MNFIYTIKNQHERIVIGILDYISTNLFGNMFDFIRWEDKEPWCIEDLKKLEVKG